LPDSYPARVARYGATDVARLMNERLHRVANRLKIDIDDSTTRGRARAARSARDRSTSYLGSFLDALGARRAGAPSPAAHGRRSQRRRPLRTPCPADLKKTGLPLLSGSTIIYAFMQATGLVRRPSSRPALRASIHSSSSCD